MKKPLNRTTVDRQVSEMWDNIHHMSDEDNGKEDAMQHAIKTQASLYKQLDIQDKVFEVLWPAVHAINPDHPMVAALSISANAERLIPVLKSYQMQEA